MTEEFGAIILAGGESRRMGTHKSELYIQNNTFTERIFNTLRPFVKHTYISINHNNFDRIAEASYVKDIYKDKGPLGGIYSGLYHSNYQKNIVISCDTPLIDLKTINGLIQQSDFSFPINYYENYPLIGLYDKKIINNLKNTLLSKDLSVQNFLLKVKSKKLSVPESIKDKLVNINTPKDYLEWIL